ncbi:hypothetical protein [Streptomyces sp. Sge12]|uniref:hypothetical protein n=1 Tax=unclassified Streptomyces TaxID=2593676 RepID=UPI0026896884
MREVDDVGGSWSRAAREAVAEPVHQRVEVAAGVAGLHQPVRDQQQHTAPGQPPLQPRGEGGQVLGLVRGLAGAAEDRGDRTDRREPLAVYVADDGALPDMGGADAWCTAPGRPLRRPAADEELLRLWDAPVQAAALCRGR